MHIHPKHRTFFILTTAEIFGLLLTKPKDMGLFFLTWAFLALVLLVYAVLKYHFPSHNKDQQPNTATLPTPTEEDKPLESTAKATPFMWLKTPKNTATALLLVINLLLYGLFR